MRVDGLVDLGECVEQAPGIPELERFMFRLAPLHEHVRDLGRRDCRTIHRSDDDVVRPFVGDPLFLVGNHPLIESTELVPKLTNGAGRQVPEVTFCETCVFSADPHLAAEAEVVTNEDPRACHKTGGIRHVVTVADAHDPTEVRFCTIRQGDGHHPEVSGSFVAECVGFLKDGEPAGFQLGFDLTKDRCVAERIPRLGPARCRHGKEILAADGFGSAMEKHSTRRSLSAGLRVFDDVHWFCLETTQAEDISAPDLCLVSVRSARPGASGVSGGLGGFLSPRLSDHERTA